MLSWLLLRKAATLLKLSLERNGYRVAQQTIPLKLKVFVSLTHLFIRPHLIFGKRAPACVLTWDSNYPIFSKCGSEGGYPNYLR